MPAALIYLLKFSVSLGVVFLFYQLVLRRLTFYNWNRWYLLGYTLLSFVIPFIDITPALHQNELTNSDMVQWVPLLYNKSTTDNSLPGFTAWNILAILIVCGMLVMLLRLLLQLFSFRRMMKKAKFISGDGINLYQVDAPIIPFSFGNAVFINRDLHTAEELEEIIRHEFVHVKQRHSIDIISGEILCLLNWYNPFAWMLRSAIRQNLEFVADDKVLENGINKKQYQYLLLKVIGNNQFSIAQKFNFSSLKKRIAMMNKIKSAKVHLLRFLFLLPVLAVILVSFRKQIGDSLAGKSKHLPTPVVISTSDTVPAVVEPNSKGYIINIVGNKGDCTVVIKDKAGKEVKKVLLTEWNANDEKYEAMYGEIPPPPPPDPPTAPETVLSPTSLTPPASVQLPDNVQKINVNNGKAIVILKNGTTEKYNLEDIRQRVEFEKKYGVLPEPPPPPELPNGVKDISINGKNFATVTMENGVTEKYDLKNEAEKAKFEKKYGKVLPPPPPPPAPILSRYEGKLSKISDDFEITDKKAVLHLKNGKTEVYDLTDVSQRKKFEEKYGKIISLADAVAPVSSVSEVVSVKNVPGITIIASVLPTPAADVIMVDDYSYTVTGKEDILLTITKNTTPDQLEDFKKQMKGKGIDLNYDEIKYDNGKLVKLTGTMKSKESRSNFVGIDFDTLLLAMIKKGDRTYFKVSVKDNKIVI